MVIAQKVDVCRLNAHLLVDFQLQNEKNLNNEVSLRVPQTWFSNGRIGELNRHGARSLPRTNLGLQHGFQLCLIELDDLLLVPLEPDGQAHQQQLPRVQNRFHGRVSVLKSPQHPRLAFGSQPTKPAGISDSTSS